MNTHEYLSAMKADSIPAGKSGLWYIVKNELTRTLPATRHGKIVQVPAGKYTALYRLTEATLHHEQPGEVVMEDTPFELKTHLEFVMKAKGKVLVCGLGLGCVARGLLANPAVTHVTVIENSPDVLALVVPHVTREKNCDRLQIICADALEWTAANTEEFDCAWHDLWTDRESGEPHLDIWHAELIANCFKFVDRQGAWSFARPAKKLLQRGGFPWIG